MKLTYYRKGDYFYPNLVLEPEEPVQLGKYGHLRMRFLKERHRGVYEAMLLEGMLNRHLAEVDRAANEMLDRLIPQMAKAEDVTEALKAQDQMQWVQRMNNIRDRAEEVILNDLVYASSISV